jgi:hypothetical protein
MLRTISVARQNASPHGQEVRIVRPGRIERSPSMGKTNEENVKTGQQETNEPWKKPDRSDHHPDKDSPNPRPRRPEDNKTA